jgi:TonB family protein
MIASKNRGLGIAVLLAWCTLCATAQSDKRPSAEPKKDSDEPVYDLVEGIAPPKLIKHVDPQYPPDWDGVRVKGNVGIAVVVNSQGLPRDPKVIKSLEKNLDQFAVDAVKQWRFAAARKDGKPVAVRIAIEIEFHSM